MQLRFNGLLLTLSLLLLSACDQWQNSTPAASEPEVKDIPPVDKHGRVAAIGSLGNQAIAIPGSVYMDGWVRYMGDPSDFDFSKEAKAYRKEKYKKIGYDRQIEGFGFDMRITDGAIRMMGEATNQAFLDDNIEHAPKGEPYPWADISIEGIKVNYPDQQNKNFYLASILKPSALQYNYQLQKQRINDLIWYQANGGISPRTGKPWEKFYGQDILVERNSNSNAITVIKCDVGGHVKHCAQNFIMPELRAWITISYDRHYLPQWQTMEKQVKTILNSWIVNPEKASLAQ